MRTRLYEGEEGWDLLLLAHAMRCLGDCLRDAGMIAEVARREAEEAYEAGRAEGYAVGHEVGWAERAGW